VLLNRSQEISNSTQSSFSPGGTFSTFQQRRRIAALQSIEELKGLTLEELEWIANSGTERSMQDGELIFSHAAPPPVSSSFSLAR
jgi:hypothetical protein